MRKAKRFSLRKNKAGKVVIVLEYKDAKQMLASAHAHTGCWDPDDEWTEYFEQLMDDMKTKLKCLFPPKKPPRPTTIEEILSEETKELAAVVRESSKPNATTQKALADSYSGKIKKFRNCNELYSDLGIV